MNSDKDSADTRCSDFSSHLRTEDLITSETITQNFCFRLDALRRRIVILCNDLRAFKLGQKGKLEFGGYLTLLDNNHIRRQ